MDMTEFYVKRWIVNYLALDRDICNNLPSYNLYKLYSLGATKILGEIHELRCLIL